MIDLSGNKKSEINRWFYNVKEHKFEKLKLINDK
jgi:hypothetical protein